MRLFKLARDHVKGTVALYVTMFDANLDEPDPDYEALGEYSVDELRQLLRLLDTLLGGGRDELVETLDQLLDDMQEGQCVSEAAKQMAIDALRKAKGGE